MGRKFSKTQKLVNCKIPCSTIVEASLWLGWGIPMTWLRHPYDLGEASLWLGWGIPMTWLRHFYDLVEMFLWLSCIHYALRHKHFTMQNSCAPAVFQRFPFSALHLVLLYQILSGNLQAKPITPCNDRGYENNTNTIAQLLTPNHAAANGKRKRTCLQQKSRVELTAQQSAAWNPLCPNRSQP